MPSGWILILLLVAVVGFYVLKRRRPVRRPQERAALPPPMPPGSDLASLGLSEVRVAPKRETSQEPARPVARPVEPIARPAESAAWPVHKALEQTGRMEPQPVAPSQPTDSAPATIRPGTDLWTRGGQAAAHLLASLAEYVGGTAAVLRYEDGAYIVEALAGTDGKAPDSIDADDCPLHRAPQDRVLTVLPNNLKGLKALGDASRAYARALAEPPAARIFLVVGTHEVAEDLDALGQIERYADLLASITTLGVVPTGSSADEPALPRAAVIREEQEAALEGGWPLAFALVTLAHVEDLLKAGGSELSSAESDLHARLAAAPGVRRVEPFDELLVGTFLNLTPEEMAEWCTELAASDPPLFIGAVAPAEGAPEAVRHAAAEALRDAYIQHRAQIVTA